MRRASKILGTVGGIMTIFIAIIVALVGMLFAGMGTPNWYYDEELGEMTHDSLFVASSWFLVRGAIIMSAGILSIVAASMVKKKKVLAGVLMLISSAVILYTLWALLYFPLVLLGGIFALTKDKEEQVQVPAENII